LNILFEQLQIYQEQTNKLIAKSKKKKISITTPIGFSLIFSPPKPKTNNPLSTILGRNLYRCYTSYLPLAGALPRYK